MSQAVLVRRWLPVILLLLIVPATAVTVLLMGGAVGPPGPGLPDPGPITRWGAPVARAIHNTAAALTIGFLVMASFVLPHPSQDRGRLGAVASRAVTFAAASASVWAVSGAAVVTFAYSDVAGTGLSAIDGAAMVDFLVGFDLGSSLGVSAFLAMVVATVCWLATRTTTAGAMTLVSLLALMPLTVTAHGASNHEAAVNLLGLHLIGATIWVGGLVALVVLRPRLGDGLVPAVRRYSMIAGWAYVLVLVSGVGGALLRLSAVSGLETIYGLVLIAKTGAALALGAAGWYQRRRIIAALGRAAEGKAFVSLALSELALMAFTFGLSVALGRTSPFADSPLQTAAESLLGAALPPQPDAIHWLTQWRFDVIWAPVALLLLGRYLRWVRAVRQQGHSWPASRTIAWSLGCVLLIWATNGAPAVYARLLPSMLVTAQVIVGLMVPVLLAYARPLQLAGNTLSKRTDESMGIKEWATRVAMFTPVRKLARPAPAGALYVAFHASFYFSPALGPLVSSNAGRISTTAFALITGFLLAHTLSSHRATRSWQESRIPTLLAVLVFHITAGGVMIAGANLIGGDWYVLMGDLWNIPAPADQHLAGYLLWAAALPPLLMLAINPGTPTDAEAAGTAAAKTPAPAHMS